MEREGESEFVPDTQHIKQKHTPPGYASWSSPCLMYGCPDAVVPAVNALHAVTFNHVKQYSKQGEIVKGKVESIPDSHYTTPHV